MADLKFLDNLSNSFSKLPGVGKKTAKRYAYSIIESMSNEDAEDFAKQIVDIKHNVKKCSICGMYTMDNICDFCKNQNRDLSTIMVLKDTKDILSIEETNEYHGLYHSLNGLINPLNGVSPDDLNIDSLFLRVNQSLKEIILATPFSSEGETTALYLDNLLKKYDVKVSRLSFGIPAGGDIEYVDELTLRRSIDNRIVRKDN